MYYRKYLIFLSNKKNTKKVSRKTHQQCKKLLPKRTAKIYTNFSQIYKLRKIKKKKIHIYILQTLTVKHNVFP